MAIDYVMPKLAMAMNEGTINEWLVKEGDFVEKGGVLATIETEKVAYDVESPEEGYIHILVPEGETVDCEVLIAQFAADAAELEALQQIAVEADAQGPGAGTAQASPSEPAQATVAPQAAALSGARIKASPLARKLAALAGLELAGINGTGPGGRIVKRDVLAAEQQLIVPGLSEAGGNVLARIPMRGMRKTIATRMTQSLNEAAQLSSAWESDITDLMEVRTGFVSREKQLGTRVSMNAFLVKALVYAVRQVPVANSCLENEEVVIYENINLGIAISVPGETDYDSGLMVGVMHDVHKMGVVEIDLDMKSLIDRVRSGRATAEDLSGSTITLSSTVGLAPPGMTTTPVLNQPNAALLGPSTPIERVVSRNGDLVVRTMLPLSFTFDHRMLDGEPAARFMAALHECLEHPELMLA